MSVKEKNLSILEKNYNLDIDKITSEVSGNIYKAEYSKKGLITVSAGGRYIHSKYDPAGEADKIIRTAADTSSDCWVFGGFGLGYHIEAFLKYTENAKAVVVEPDPLLFRTAVEERDLSEILLSGRVVLVINAPADSIISTLNMLQFEKIKYFQIRSEYELNSSYFEDLKNSVASYISRKDVNNNTLIRFGKIWVKNLLLNLPVFSRSPGVDSLKELFNGIPAFILAGGPGLDRTLKYLKDTREKCIIIAVDTSISAALRYGVEPDFLIVVDPQYWNFRHLDRCRLKNTIVVSEPSAYSHTFRNPEINYVFASSVFPLGQKIEKETFLRGKLGAGGSVSTTAWDFARKLGCSTIIFAGLDLSYPDKLTHFKGSFFEERSHTLSGRTRSAALMDYQLITDASLIVAEDNSGSTVFTDKRLIIYKQWFEEQHRQYKQNTLTLSDKGIKIEGINLVTQEYIENLTDCRNEIDNIIESIKSDKNTQKADISKYIEISRQTEDSLLSLKKTAERGTDLCSRILNDGKYSSSDADALNSIDREILRGESRDTAGFLLQEISRNILTAEKETELDKVIGNSKSIYENLVKSTDYHITLLKKALKIMSES